MEDELLMVGAAVAFLAAGLVILLFIVAFRPWVRALVGGAPVPLPTILAMRLRGTPPGLLIDALLALKQRGIPISLEAIENTYLLHKASGISVEELVERIVQEGQTRE